MEDKKLNIICFGYDTWSSMWKREQSLMYYLAKKSFINRLIFVNPVLPVSYLASRKRFKWNFAKGWKRMILPRKVAENIWALTPFYLLPFTWRYKIIRKINARLVSKLIALFLGPRQYIVVINNPCFQIEPLADIFLKNASLVIFDWADDWAAFEKDNSERKKVEGVCEKYIKSSDMVLTVNENLGEMAKALNKNTFILHNATNYEIFSQQINSNYVAELKSASRPIIGYAGWIVESRIDLEIIEYMSKRHPAWTILFVGPIKEDFAKKLSLIPNLKLLPPVDYTELPKFIRNFDVCIIPNKINQFTDGNNPIKFFDYLATGRPIVTTKTAGANNLKDVINIAETKEEFINKVEEVLTSDTFEKITRRKEIARLNSWETRVDKMAKLIEAHIDRKQGVRTLLFTTQYPPHIGGVPTFYYYLTKNFAKREIAVLTAREDGWEQVDKEIGFPIYRNRLLNRFKTENKLSFVAKSCRLFFYTLWVISKEKIDCIILGRPDVTLLFICYLIKALLKKEYIVFNHGDGEAPAIKCKIDSFKKYFYGKAKTLIANSSFTKSRLISKYYIPSDKIFILYPGVDTKLFHPINNGSLKNELCLADKKILLTVGRLYQRKGHDMVLRALPKVIKEIPNVVYLIVGKGKFELELIKLTKELGIEAYVKFMRDTPDKELVKLYNICDVFIMPNRELDGGDTEGFGMVFLEANACGKPVIGGRCGGAVEAVKENETGLLVNPYDADDISQKITYLLRNEQTARLMGEDGRKRASNEFEWDTNIKENINKFKNAFLNRN